MKLLGLTFAIVAYLAVCCSAFSGAPGEEVTEYCEEQCKDICIPCQEPVRCTEEENDCGLGQPDPAFGGVCPPHSICVKKGFNCKSLDYIRAILSFHNINGKVT